MTDGTAADIWLGDAADFKGGLRTRVHAFSFQDVLQGEGGNDGGEDTGVISGDAVHAVGFRLGAPPDIATPDDDAHADAHLRDLFYLPGDPDEDGVIDAVALPAA